MSSSRGIFREKGRKLKTTWTLILTSNQRQKPSELKPRVKPKKNAYTKPNVEYQSSYDNRVSFGIYI